MIVQKVNNGIGYWNRAFLQLSFLSCLKQSLWQLQLTDRLWRNQMSDSPSARFLSDGYHWVHKTWDHKNMGAWLVCINLDLVTPQGKYLNTGLLEYELKQHLEKNRISNDFWGVSKGFFIHTVFRKKAICAIPYSRAEFFIASDLLWTWKRFL